MVIEHYKELFGANTIYLDPQTMKTQIGVVSRNDGIIIALDQSQWYILEVELATHSLHKHIIPQITRFNIAYQQPETRRKLVDSISNTIRSNPYKTAMLQAQKIEDVHEYLSKTIENPPIIAIITDQKPPELEAVSKNLPFKTKATEFKTYTRENTGMKVHVHAFEPLYEKSSIPKILLNILTVLEQVYNKRKTYDEAAKIVAKKLKLHEGTIRAACTRDIGLSSKQFRKLLKDKEKLKTLLTEKYPDHQNTINETIQ
ncbi:hypothetical protein HXY32_01200 [Candidatus Bathyarchaeota archaeon]|nr:hypothetical protein [Candidatus Bathyarchaeota archaeon]